MTAREFWAGLRAEDARKEEPTRCACGCGRALPKQHHTYAIIFQNARVKATHFEAVASEECLKRLRQSGSDEPLHRVVTRAELDPEHPPTLFEEDGETTVFVAEAPPTEFFDDCVLHPKHIKEMWVGSDPHSVNEYWQTARKPEEDDAIRAAHAEMIAVGLEKDAEIRAAKAEAHQQEWIGVAVTVEEWLADREAALKKIEAYARERMAEANAEAAIEALNAAPNDERK